MHHFNQILKRKKLDYSKHIYYITGPNQSQKMVTANFCGTETFTNNLNHIFVAPNYETLISWKYDLTKVFYVFDYQKDSTFNYNYADMCYKQISY